MLRGLFFAAAFVALCVSAFAQTATGILQGRVADASASAVPEAKVTIENQLTGVRQTILTNAEGIFVQPFLLPGGYKVTVEKAGFEKYVTSDIRISVQQTVSLDVSLKVGDIATAVEVQATGVELATSSATVSTVIPSKSILDLPLSLSGRNPFGLATLTPGVIATSNGGSVIPWISGGRNAESEITVDGTSVILPENNVSVNTLAYTPIQDSVEEFSVVTNALNAEYGRTGGGVINVATRSGTNTLHGSAYDFLGNSDLNTNTWVNNRNGAKLAAYQRNLFGGTIGGPVWIPKVYNGKNRTFFFFSEQSQRFRNGASATATVPIQAWRDGDFSDLRNGSGGPITLFDPLTVSCTANCDTATAVYSRSAFAGNVIPKSRFDPVAVNMMRYYPQPNATPNNPYTYLNNFFSTGKSLSNDDKFDSRLDENFGSKFRIFGRGSHDYSHSLPFNGFGTIGTSSGSGPSSNTANNVTVNGIYTFNPTTILNVNYGFGRFVNLSDPFSSGTHPSSLGFPTSLDGVSAVQNFEFPNITFGGNTNLSNLGQATFTTLRYRPYSHVLRADLTKIKGIHTIKFGGEFRKMFMNFEQFGDPDGEWSFNSGYTQQVLGAAASTTQGNGVASFLLGIPASGDVSHTFAIASASAYWGFYLQDDVRVSTRLTLNLGIRYDVDIPRTERYNRLAYFDLNAPSPIAGQVPGDPNLVGVMRFAGGPGAKYGRHQTPTDLHDIGPRFGFAYRLDEKTVFRGAYAMLYSGSVMQAAGTSGTAGVDGFQTSTTMNVSFDGGRTIAAYLHDPFPAGYNLPLGATDGPYSGKNTDIGGGPGSAMFIDYRNPRIQQWNGTLQRETKGGMLLQAGYLGSKGNHLIDGESSMAMNQLPSSYWALGNQLLGTNQVANPFYGVILNPTVSLSQPTISYSQLLRPYPQFSSVSPFRKPQANSLYHSGIFRAEKRFSNGLNLLASLTLGKLIDDASQVVTFLGAAGTKQDYYNRKAERSVSAQDVSRQLNISFNYELPFGRSRPLLSSIPKALDYFIGGWQANGIYTYHTGLPLQIANPGNNTFLGSPGQRPNNNGQSAKLSGAVESRLNQYFNTADFSQAGNFTFGTSSRTSPDLRSPSTHNLDASLFKNFRIQERTTLQFRGEAFNISNTPVWAAPGTTVNVAGFGVITNATAQRVIQLALKLMF
jgi:hypothetical protein